ncbi:Alpha/Beta hydrolase protein [Apiosordaria backusii]|uniref:Alpha/Beta hydrolase protein n=1 Tax=Apiosordaria backusii TaxID=314023 RepID=A0AA40ERR2_9PEZI|nr:Alpha/Beta hydrolase protein [Apiosordaria backusii]
MTLTVPEDNPLSPRGDDTNPEPREGRRDYSTFPDVSTHDRTSFPYIFSKNVSVPLSPPATGTGLIRCNVYRPHGSDTKPVPVLVTYGPYGKDIPYSVFNPQSFSEVNPAHKSPHSCWETPDPSFWTAAGYALVRGDELGTGQSPGFLDTMSRSTSEAFSDLITWAASQPWSTGKVGLLGVSYYAGSQWRVAARKPKGLAAMVPWEGMSDYYRDRCRHGGIYSSGFVERWWDRQVVGNQYGLKGRDRGERTVDDGGEMGEEELERNRRDQRVDNRENRFRDEEYYREKEYDLGDVEGFVHAGSEYKFLRMITGRHDLPFYYEEEVEVQRSFLDAFLKGEDRDGWTTGGKPRVDLIIRKGDAGVNDARKEREMFKRRLENEWPLGRTRYTKYYLGCDLTMKSRNNYAYAGGVGEGGKKLGYRALGSIDNPQTLAFQTVPSEMSGQEMEITGHIVAHLNVSVSPDRSGPTPSDIDLFLTLRHIGADGKEIFYTGTAGDPVPLTKGWLRASLRKVNKEHPKHREWLPHRDYTSKDVLPVIQGDVYPVDVELWPTCVVLQEGEALVLEVSSGDTQGSGIFLHNDPVDRSPNVFQGMNYIHISKQYENYLVLPVIPHSIDGS